MEIKNQDKDKEIKQLKEQNSSLQQADLTLECRAKESYLKLRGIPEEDENIYEMVLDKLARSLEE